MLRGLLLFIIIVAEIFLASIISLGPGAIKIKLKIMNTIKKEEVVNNSNQPQKGKSKINFFVKCCLIILSTLVIAHEKSGFSV